MPQEGRTPYKFSELIEDAGIGTLMLSRSSYFAGKYYHHIVALFTATIVVLSLFPLIDLSLVILCVAAYGIYFFERKRLSPQAERIFYRPANQFWRAQVGLAAVTFLLLAVPGAEHSLLWLLFIPVILLTSKHCTTRRLYLVVAESALALFLARVWHQWPASLFPEFIQANPDLLVEILWLAFLSFVMHYLVRNIQARDDTIAGITAVGEFTRDVDMTDPKSTKQWQPMLTALLKYLEGECASAWLANPQTRQLQLIASARRNPQNAQAMDFMDSTANMLVPLDGNTLIASVARKGEPAHSVVQTKGQPAPYACPGCCPLCETVAAELVVPINLGSKEHYSTIGVLSVGFLSSSYKKSHLNQYWNFMTGMVNQAKPMLVYAARLEELNALQNISRQVSRSLNLNEVLDRILQAIVNTLGFEFATISLVDEQNRLVRAKRGINVPQKWLDMAVHALDSSDIQADIIRTGKTEIISDWDNRFDKRIWDKFGHDDMVRVFAPIAVVDDTAHCERIIGTIEAGYHRTTRTEITADQQRLLGAFKTQVSLAIEQAQLLDRVQKKAEVLTSLHHVGQVIASARDLSQVLEEIGHSAAVLLKADIVMLYRYNRDKRVVENPVVYGGVAPKTRLNLDLSQQNILTRLLSDTQPYYSADAQSDQLLTALAADADKPGKSKHTFIHVQNIKSFVGIPLMANGEIVGIMFVNYRARHTFDEDEKQVHELFAQQAAVAIKNAEINRLERALVVREERNHLSRELHHSVSQALFGIKLQAQNAMNEIPAPEGNVHTKLSNILEIAHVASNETNFIIEELRSPVEEDRNMVERLEEYIQRVRRWYALDVVLTHGVTPHLPPEVEQKLFRFAREAINNAVRHSRSRTIRVCCEQNWSHFRLSVQDDGIGFDQKRIPPNKLGLTSMRELAAGIGGSFSLQTAPGYGTMASIQISLDQEAEGHD